MAAAANTYAPVLKWKQGEQLAAKPLTAAQKSRLLPIAELPDRPYNWKDQRYTKSWERHLDDLVASTATNWGTGHEIALDQAIDEGDSLSTGTGTPWEHLFAQMWASGVKAVPVISTRASATEQAALVAVSKAHKRNRWVLRLRSNPHGAIPSPAHAAGWFSNALIVIGAKASQVDAVVDLGHLEAEPKAMASGVSQTLKAVAALGPWKRLVLLSGAFPVNLAGVGKGTKQIERSDWDLFKRVCSRSELDSLELVFGDYGVTHVDAFEDDPRKIVMSSNLRYAHWQQWHVLKGKNTRDYGYEPYKDLCKLLIALPIYMQPPFSQGDDNYHKVATDPSAGPGNAMQWRRDATNHHVHVVLHQLAGLPEA